MRIPCSWTYGEWKAHPTTAQPGLLVGLEHENGYSHAFVVKEDGEIMRMRTSHVRVTINKCFSKTA